MQLKFFLLVTALCAVLAQIIAAATTVSPSRKPSYNTTVRPSVSSSVSASVSPSVSSSHKPNATKPGRCPYSVDLWDEFICHNGTNTCADDSDCSGVDKCCQLPNCRACMYPNFGEPTAAPEPTPKPYHYQPGHCPRHFERYYGYDNHGITCANHCNSNEDCALGELCCVESEVYDDEKYHEDWMPDSDTRCPVCKKADLGCTNYAGEYVENYKLFRESYDNDGCSINQCYNGDVIYFYTCDYNQATWWGYMWIAAGASAGAALLISVIFTLSVCCCLKCCCKDKQQTIVVQPPPPPVMQAQQPGNFYYMAPRQEEKAPLTSASEA